MVTRASRWIVAVAVAAVLALLVATRGPHQPYAPLSAGAGNLRAQFNADAGKVRMIILPAPT